MKPFYKSRTIRIAIIQGLVAVMTAVATEYDWLGAALAAKTFLDIYLRLDTSETVRR